MDPPEILRDAYCALQNDQTFYQEFHAAESSAGARNAIHVALIRLGTKPELPQHVNTEDPARAAREALRQLLEAYWGCRRKSGSQQLTKAVASYLQAPVPAPAPDPTAKVDLEAFVEAKAQAKAQAKAMPEPDNLFDYRNLPTGTLLTTANGYVYEKEVPPAQGFPPNIDAYELRGRRVSPHDPTAWCGWDRYGKVAPNLCIVSFEIPTKALLSTPAADTMAILHHYPESTTMIEITTKTLVNGQDISTLSKPAIYDLIASQEAQIATLEAIKTKPIMLRREIQARQEGVNALVAYLDSLEPAQAVQGLAEAVQGPAKSLTRATPPAQHPDEPHPALAR